MVNTWKHRLGGWNTLSSLYEPTGLAMDKVRCQRHSAEATYPSRLDTDGQVEKGFAARV
jgi:hypothetical protein